MSRGAYRNNPYPGLRPYAQDESHLFFGRERNIDELLNHLRVHRFLAVLGASGTGKSSLVMAGLLPHLEGGFRTKAGSKWTVVSLRPGADPIGNLARALHSPRGADDEVLEIAGPPPLPEPEGLDPQTSSRMERSRLAQEETLHEISRLERDLGLADEETPGVSALDAGLTEATLRRGRRGIARAVRELRLASDGNLLILVDQFEELFRFSAQRSDSWRDDASAFVNLLLEPTLDDDGPGTGPNNIHVLITMRSDFLGACVRYNGLPEAINRGQYLVPRLDRAQMEQAIRAPARVGRSNIAVDLLQQILIDIDIENDQLPILQHALMRTYAIWAEEGSSEEIGWVEYARSGGLGEALSRHAEEAYAELETEGPRFTHLCRAVFSALTDTLDGRGVRRPCSVGQLATISGASEDEIIRIVEVFRREDRAFLMPPVGVELEPRTVVDISHESLMRVWTRLRGWVSDNARDTEIFRRLMQAAELRRLGEGGLWRNPELAVATAWRDRVQPTEAWAARFDGDFELAMAFLDDSIAGHQRELAEREQADLVAARQAQALAEADRDRQAAESKARWEILKRYMVIAGSLVAVYVGWSTWSQVTREECPAPLACMEPATALADRECPECEDCDARQKPAPRDCAAELASCAEALEGERTGMGAAQQALCNVHQQERAPLLAESSRLRRRLEATRARYEKQLTSLRDQLATQQDELAAEKRRVAELEAKLDKARRSAKREAAVAVQKIAKAKEPGTELARVVLYGDVRQACRWLKRGKAGFLAKNPEGSPRELAEHLVRISKEMR